MIPPCGRPGLTGAEANLLKFFEMEGLLSEEDAKRWEEIKAGFRKKKLLGGSGENDPVARVVAQLSEFNEGLGAIQEGIARAGADYAQPQSLTEETVTHMKTIIEGLRAVPVKVDINVLPVQEEGGQIESIEKTSRKTEPKKKARKSPIEIKPDVSQGE